MWPSAAGRDETATGRAARDPGRARAAAACRATASTRATASSTDRTTRATSRSTATVSSATSPVEFACRATSFRFPPTLRNTRRISVSSDNATTSSRAGKPPAPELLAAFAAATLTSPTQARAANPAPSAAARTASHSAVENSTDTW